MPLPFIIGVGLLALLLSNGSDEGGENVKKASRKIRRQFNKRNVQTMFQKPGIYILYNKANKIMMVASTDNLRRSLENEFIKGSKAASFVYKTTQNTREAHELKNQIIGTLKEKGLNFKSSRTKKS